jgi:hypothetical protein
LEDSTVSNLDLGEPAPRKRPAPAQPQPSRHNLVALWLSQFSATLAAHLVAVAILQRFSPRKRRPCPPHRSLRPAYKMLVQGVVEFTVSEEPGVTGDGGPVEL